MRQMEQLVAAFGRNAVVVVAGTGVTASATRGAATSTWQGLLSNGVARLKPIDKNKAALAELMLDEAESPKDYASVAEHIKRTLGQNFGRWLEDAIGKLDTKDDQLIKAIGSLNVPILTTNYDTLIEKVLQRSSTSWTNSDEFLRVFREESGAIGHLHGVWNDPTSIIFTIEDYNRIVNNSDAQIIQKSAFNMKSFLFIGVGEGIQDPNIDVMIKDFSRLTTSTSGTHFRLCLDSDYDQSTELSSVVDVSFGAQYEDLPKFLSTLASRIHSIDVDIQRKSRESLLETLRENSTMWRDSEILNEKTFNELIIRPTFLPEPHNQFATSTVTNAAKARPKPIEINSYLQNDDILVIAGEENSGVTTAVNFCLNTAMDIRTQSHAILVSKPLKPGINKLQEQVRKTYRDWGLSLPKETTHEGLILGVDNLRFDESIQFNRAIDGIRNVGANLKIIGVRQGDEASIVDALKKSGIKNKIQIAYVGKFSDLEALELAKRIAPASSKKVAHNVMSIVREKNLPRTPFTITLLIELIQSGVALNEEESELAILDKYLDLLLSSDFVRAENELKMNLRNKRKILEILAQHFVERTEDHVSERELLELLGKSFEELGWSHSPALCLNDLVTRRVLIRHRDSQVGFQRSVYLELMAGNSAKTDPNFRKTVFGAPIALATVLRTYAAMARDDEEALTIVEAELDKLPFVDIKGRVFGAVKKINPSSDQELLSERSELASDGEAKKLNDGDIENGLESLSDGPTYDDSDDSDSPAFLLTRIEDIPEWRLMMYTVDLASRVLRDSDEVRNQDLKARLLAKILSVWAAFTELYERELEGSSDLDEFIHTYFEDHDSPDEKKREELRSFLNVILPCGLTDSGIRYCLSGPSLISRLESTDLSDVPHEEFATLMRTIALYGSGGSNWIATLDSITGRGIKSLFSIYYLAPLSRYAYITNPTLTEEERGRIQKFLRRIINERYNFGSSAQRNRVNNDFENRMIKARLNFLQNPALSPC